jgi:hypothetical protein
MANRNALYMRRPNSLAIERATKCRVTSTAKFILFTISVKLQHCDVSPGI